MDLSSIAAYIGADNLSAAKRVVLRIEKSVLNLSSAPAMGVQDPTLDARLLFVPALPYLIVYRVQETTTIQILRVYHTSRNWRKL
ncbi:MAG: type II toxin-antitoxin system RelE/ParE family toxin [Magnetococcales bacterium]|nr:type II toxin-antitoxin system RelE/ParE family toxin [Magnetococcales bacterium]NGZ26411.1 type II toxin-antitoxin system RelE/ParE family toxin [Magnetococcales bacterium]